MQPEILILAAGASSRMRGGDKLLEIVNGQPQLARITDAALASGCAVTVALPPDRPARDAALHGRAVRRVVVPNPGDGMAASLTAGLAALHPDAPLLLLLADLPDLSAADLAHFLQDWCRTPDLILRATAQDGTPGHPVGFPHWAKPDLATLTGDAGARAVLQRHRDRTRLIALPHAHATTDLDTPEAWAAWRASRGE
ncbi:MAG: nucleotidyltransferase family protein [Pseudomonadota bacterium]